MTISKNSRQRAARYALLAGMVISLRLVGSAQAVWYVKEHSTPPGTGTSWATAFASLDSALLVAHDNGDQIWVAEGTYKPSIPSVPVDPRSVSFLVQHLTFLYGGFRGTETSLAERAGHFATTFLDGDVGSVGDAADNAYNVVTVRYRCVIDGFTILNGRADGGTPEQSTGGGINVLLPLPSSCPPDPSCPGGICCPLPELNLANCFLTNNRAARGGALHTISRFNIKWCSFSNNSSIHGGAIAGRSALSSFIFNSVFYSNRASLQGGAVWVGHSSHITFDGCVFHGNQATGEGGAAYLASAYGYLGGRGKWINCSLAYNSASIDGGGVYVDTSDQSLAGNGKLYNSIIWANSAPLSSQLAGTSTVEYSDVQMPAGTTWPGTGNINGNPLFANGPIGRLRLTAGSPCIDAAWYNVLSIDHLDLDGDGNTAERVPLDVGALSRLVDDPATTDTGVGEFRYLDMGADEFP